MVVELRLESDTEHKIRYRFSRHPGNRMDIHRIQYHLLLDPESRSAKATVCAVCVSGPVIKVGQAKPGKWYMASQPPF